MKESGINYFFGKLGFNSGTMPIFYTFEEGAGNIINSIPSGNPFFSGILSEIDDFWIQNGSGFLNGNTISVEHSSGLYSENWTKIFVYEKINQNEFILFNSLNQTSGCKIGITNSNKVYFETLNVEPIIATTSNNLSSKNAISVSYLPNFLTIGLYDFSSKNIEFESFDLPFELVRSDDWKIGGQTGFLDYFIYSNEYKSPDVLSQFFSGFWFRPTGSSNQVETYFTTGITGYQNVLFLETGITGYRSTPGGDEGRDNYTGAFPTYLSTEPLTGVTNTGFFKSGVAGIVRIDITGGAIDLLENLSGYGLGFGMENINILSRFVNEYNAKIGVDTNFENIYNKNAERSFSSFQYDNDIYQSGQICLFLNGLSLLNGEWYVSGSYIYTDSESNDIALFDSKSGEKNGYLITGGLINFPINYSGQQIFLNGLNLISGYDFTKSGSQIVLTDFNTGITGFISEYPLIKNIETTGSSYRFEFQKFSRNSSMVFLNGVRQRNKYDYIESSNVDLLSGNSYNINEVVQIYNNNDLYWET